MTTDYKFEGWMGEDERSAEGNMVWQEYEPKKWEETDVDIRITHCGICGSDIHVLRSGWVSLNEGLLLHETPLINDFLL
jgi:threonine dehydrogenase-like Zn-dependent dehydrogenase